MPHHTDTDHALALGLDRPADLRVEGFGWRIATAAFVERWKREHVELTAIGYRVLWNKCNDLLVSYWPIERQVRDASPEAPGGFYALPDANKGDDSSREELSRQPERPKPVRRSRQPALRHNGPVTQPTLPHVMQQRGRRSHGADNSSVVPGDGPPCPRCRRPMQICEHATITERELRKPFYYRHWYRCAHADCRTKLVMPDEFKVASKQR